jgi:LysR family glycine cleavage system transcriptional activator
MRNYLPLNALRAFESAARHLSFSRAAHELCVTPTAISHQVRTLEEFLEISLFERKNGRIALTAAAAASLEELSEGFNKLEQAISPLSRRAGRQKITVAASPSFASLWLLPRLEKFVEIAPELDVIVSTIIAPGEFGENGFDVAICCTDEFPNRRVDFLMSEQIVPVCAPSLLPGKPSARRAALSTLPLIHDDKPNNRFPTWRRYFEQVRIAAPNANNGLRFNLSSLAIAAGINGHGMLLGRTRLIASAVRQGHLVPVIEDPYAVSWNYFTVRRRGVISKPVKAFLDWLEEEARDETEGLSLPPPASVAGAIRDRSQQSRVRGSGRELSVTRRVPRVDPAQPANSNQRGAAIARPLN